MSNFHIPVMPRETIDFLNVQKNHWFIDCNLGGGGQTELILKSHGNVIGIDLDPDAIYEVAKNHSLEVKKVGDHLEAHSKNLILYQSNFAQIDQVFAAVCHPEPLVLNSFQDRVSGSNLEISLRQLADRNDINISGILFDLGVSSYQLETAKRGFSFNKDAPLDMRMNPEIGIPAKDLVNGLHEKELAQLFLKLGEENFAKPIARRIVQRRKFKLIETTNELSNLILQVRRRSSSDRTHPSTKVFQALRIAVNDELNSLKEALPKAFEILEPGGRIIVISFHSLEDRIVKDYFRSICHPELDSGSKPKAILLTKKPLETSAAESLENPRARSAKLRAIEKLTL